MIDTAALREKVLDLAIRGKLVPQDPNDEPASVLLDRIRKQKEQMVKEGTLKAKDIKNDTIIFKGEDNLHYEQFQDGTVKCIEDEIPFDLPNGWAWCHMLNIAEVELGKTLDKSKNTGNFYQYLRSINIKWNDSDISDLNEMRFEADELERYTVRKNDLLICEGGDVGRCCVWEKEPILYQNALHRVRFFDLCNSYFYMYLLMFLENRGYLKRISNGVTIKHLTKGVLNSIVLPLPPIVEQQKISNTIGKLFRFIETIEQEVTSICDLVNKTKSKILDLAIRGKLVPQDENDEPASVLLERIKAEKEELIKAVKIKRDKKESIIFKGDDNSYYEKIGSIIKNIDDEIPFDIPDNWNWCRGYSCFSGMKSTKPSGNTFKYIDIESIDNKVQKIKDAKTLATDKAPSRASRAVDTGSVLFSFVRPYLKNIAYVSEENADCIASTGFYVCNSNGALDCKFMYYLMISDYVVKGLNQFMKGDNSPSITKDNIEDWLYPIPPLTEQKEICKKISTLYEFIDEIEKSLS